MKRIKNILAIIILTCAFNLSCSMPPALALFREDVNVSEAEKAVNLEREQSRIKLEEKETEEPAGEFKPAPLARTKPAAAKVCLDKKLIAGVILAGLLLAIAAMNKFCGKEDGQEGLKDLKNGKTGK